jgi:hypothetical protein
MASALEENGLSSATTQTSSENGSQAHCCHDENSGPGYATPLDAYTLGPREKILYVTAVYSGGHLSPAGTIASLP